MATPTIRQAAAGDAVALARIVAAAVLFSPVPSGTPCASRGPPLGAVDLTVGRALRLMATPKTSPASRGRARWRP